MMNSKQPESVKVVVRCRPLSEKEAKAGYERVIGMEVSKGTVMVKNPNKQEGVPREFTFDSVYDWNSKQADLYDESFRPIVSAVLEGYNGTIFAYGQTGTGKTYTMEGVRSDPEQRGVIPNSFDHIFTHISGSENQQYLVRASYLEIYQEEIRDLLSKDHKRRLELRERPDTGVYVRDLSSFIAKSVKEIEHVMSIGNQNRAVGPTDMNAHSSRSHAIFIVTVECAERGSDGEDHVRVGKLNLVDLAGSERQAKTQSTGERFKEATKINLSLSALGNVISALVNAKSTHVPYRDSKLTLLLRDSLGGNSKTIMVANIGPASFNYDETLVTLRYANRAKNIKNKPRINEDPKDALLREYQDEIKRLKEALLDRKKTKKHGRKGVRAKRTNVQGEEIISEDDSGGEEESASADEGEEPEEEKLKMEQEKLEREKRSIMENTGMLEEEKEKLLKEVQHKFEELQKEQKKRDYLTSKIRAMESKLLSGGAVRISMDQRDQRKKDIQQKRQEMIELKKRERAIQQKLETQEETTVEMQGSYRSLHEEAAVKEKKLKKLQKKLKMTEVEIEDCREEQNRTREELTQHLEELEKQLKLRSLIIKHFIPPEVMEQRKKIAVYNEEDQTWETGNNSTSPPYPSTQLNLLHCSYSAGDVSSNILRLDLDVSTRTTHDYQGPMVTPTVQAVINKAVEEEEEMRVDASKFCDYPGSKQQTHKKHYSYGTRPKEGISVKKVPQHPSQEFPEKRGLVKKK